MQPVCTSVNPPLTAAGDLLVTTGTICVIGVEFINDLTVTSGATLYMSGTNVFGRFKTVQASSVILCGNLIIGRTGIAQTAGTVLVGQGPNGAIGQGLGCYGNEFDGDLLTVISNNLTPNWIRPSERKPPYKRVADLDQQPQRNRSRKSGHRGRRRPDRRAAEVPLQFPGADERWLPQPGHQSRWAVCGCRILRSRQTVSALSRHPGGGDTGVSYASDRPIESWQSVPRMP